jgi:hypothetical protein
LLARRAHDCVQHGKNGADASCRMISARAWRRQADAIHRKALWAISSDRSGRNRTRFCLPQPLIASFSAIRVRKRAFGHGKPAAELAAAGLAPRLSSLSEQPELLQPGECLSSLNLGLAPGDVREAAAPWIAGLFSLPRSPRKRAREKAALRLQLAMRGQRAMPPPRVSDAGGQICHCSRHHLTRV